MPSWTSAFCIYPIPPVSQDVIDLVIDYAPRLSSIPQEKKDRLLIRNSLHFVVYTKGKVVQREQYEFATPMNADGHPGPPSISSYGDLLGRGSADPG